MAADSKVSEAHPNGTESKEQKVEGTRPAPTVEDAPDDAGEEDGPAQTSQASGQKTKKKSKRAKMKKALGGGSDGDSAGPSTSAKKLTPDMVDQLMEMNPALKGEVASMERDKAIEMVKKMDVADLLTGLSITGKNQKDMASYKFWKTQPVPKFDETGESQEGEIKTVEPEKVPADPKPLDDRFEWVTVDLEDAEQIKEVYELLSGHYVEDDHASFRLTYSASLLNWALKSPGWRKEWFVGVRAVQSKRLVAFISAIPATLRVRSQTLKISEVNFLCVHRKLRSKRLAPVLIEEITRRCHRAGVYQAMFTSGTVLPKPVSTCRYFHRPLDWLKLYETGFSALPRGTSPARMLARFQLPSATSFEGLRPMVKSDVKSVHNLLKRYLERFSMAPEFTEEEVEHWLLHDEKASPERVVWAYVVEDSQSKKVTDFASFFCLESAVIDSKKHKSVRAAYMFYYASESAFQDDGKDLKGRLHSLMLDILLIAKEVSLVVQSPDLGSRNSRTNSMSSTAFPFLTTLCLLNLSNSGRVTGNCITIYTTIEQHQSPRDWTQGTIRTKDKWEASVLSCFKRMIPQFVSWTAILCAIVVDQGLSWAALSIRATSSLSAGGS